METISSKSSLFSFIIRASRQPVKYSDLKQWDLEWQHALKNVSYWNTKTTFILKTSCGLNLNPYLNVNFSLLISHLWHLKIGVFMDRCLSRTVLLNRFGFFKVFYENVKNEKVNLSLEEWVNFPGIEYTSTPMTLFMAFF
jgi:hypothetical protein